MPALDFTARRRYGRSISEQTSGSSHSSGFYVCRASYRCKKYCMQVTSHAYCGGSVVRCTLRTWTYQEGGLFVDATFRPSAKNVACTAAEALPFRVGRHRKILASPLRKGPGAATSIFNGCMPGFRGGNISSTVLQARILEAFVCARWWQMDARNLVFSFFAIINTSGRTRLQRRYSVL